MSNRVGQDECWDCEYSSQFGESNRVGQDEVRIPIPFLIYLDSLLHSLKHISVVSSWGGEYAGALAYADDIVLLAPSLSALRIWFGECKQCALSHGLQFNPLKTQFMQFLHHSYLNSDLSHLFSGHRLPLLSCVALGHILF